ncbi:hypothetical protein OEZ85_010997 [Tetradesmus obliquus]|uniref:DUF5901 domain-containing protein n=1 Tax=Tetradesmus obliquus TaxID=3088 RepID=A0ABY8TSU1_TETOB|nr:hypothetical protein OEZ85_010997 [Tetradesmus obliquus]
MEPPARTLRTRPCTLKRVTAAVLLLCAAIWMKTGGMPKLNAVAALLVALVLVLELAHCVLDYEALEVIVVNAMFTGLAMDDISYLQQHGEVNEYVAFVDSARRDKAAYVTPSEFAVTWNTPFTLVTGIDVIDVSLPMSGYTINTAYNQVRFRFHAPGYEDDPDYVPPQWVTVAVKPGNHTPDTLIAELKRKLVEPATAAAVPRRIDVRPASVPFELVGKLVFVSEHPFEIDTVNSSMAAVLGFSQLIDVTSSNQIAMFTDKEQLDLATNETAMLSGSTATDKGYSLTRGKYLRQRFWAPASSNLTQFEVMLVPFGNTSHLDGAVDLRIVNARTNTVVARGKIPVMFPAYSAADLDSMVFTNPGRDTFLATESYWAEVLDDNNEDPNNCYRVCYGPAPEGTGNGSTLFTVENGVVDKWYERGCMLTARMFAVPFNYLMVPPGILNLASPVGYVSLRCSEIEKHMYSSRVFESSNMGLAVVNLSKGYQEKYSLVAPKRSFHPIARLSKLTFRWEAPNGSLYDFLGVDNHITFVLRYYALPQRNTNIFSVLNPNYQPDLLRWQNQHELADADSSDDDDVAPPRPALQPRLHHATI